MILDQDPTQPVARVDGYGQPEQPQQPEQQPQLRTRAAQPAAIPHYGLPNAVVIKPGTYVTVRVDQPLSSDHNQQNDFFSATLAQPIVVDGIVVAQSGQHGDRDAWPKPRRPDVSRVPAASACN